jgi:intracellular multiplication protein IcmV
MFKKVFRGIGRVLKPLVNFPAWMGWKSLKEDNQRLARLAKMVLAPEKIEVHRETFEQAAARLGLDESDILARQRSFKRMALFYGFIALLLLIYAFYLLLSVETVIGFLTGLIAVWITLALGFKQHFWYTQMKVRRLGLTFREWFLITCHIARGI